MISGNRESNGNGSAFAVKRAGRRLDELFEAHGAAIQRLCRLVLRNTVEAEDAAQQTFLSAYRALLRGTEPREPAAWLSQIARNECRARLRRREIAVVPFEAEAEERRDPVDVAAGREQLQAIASAIKELPTRQRQAVVLSDLRGLSNNEVARAMSLAPGAVEALLYRGRLRVRRAFRRSWPATAVVPLWLRDVLVRLGAQLETSLSAAPPARVVAGVAVAVVAAGSATIEIAHQQGKPRASRVREVTGDTHVAARRHSALSEMVSVRVGAVQVDSHSHSAGDAKGGHRPHGGRRRPSRPNTATSVSSNSGPGPSSSTQQTGVSSSGPGAAPTTQPAPNNSGPGSNESASGEPLSPPDSSGGSVEAGSSGPSFESSSSGSDGSNSGPGSPSSGSDPSTSGSDASSSDSSGSDASGPDSSGSDASGSDSSGSDSSGSGSDGHRGSGE
jgi:RNA polymerase sigma factor (sigma-70 family)